MNMDEIRIVPEGDLAVLVEFENEISPACNGKVAALQKCIKEANWKGIVETIPAFRSLLIYYNPLQISYRKLVAKIKKATKHLENMDNQSKRIIQIPVCYGGTYGVDLKDVAEHTGLSEEEVIAIHSGTDYLIYMIGFLPGFPYLGGMDKRLETPRLQDPRTAIPAGAVGIGGEQTGIYPLASPGGWRLIGQTPLRLFDRERENPILYRTGDYIRFVPVTEEAYKRIAKQIETGNFDYKGIVM